MFQLQKKNEKENFVRTFKIFENFGIIIDSFWLFLVSMFNIVRFPNDNCEAGGSKNGTCYTK